MKGGYLGIDLGGTKVAFRAETPQLGTHEALLRWPSPGGLGADLQAFEMCCREVRSRCGEPIESVGAAVAATLDRRGRVTAWPNRPSWAGFDLRGFLLSAFPDATVRWADDGNLAALAEAREARCADLAYVGVGTGIGGGLVLGGQIHPRLGDGCEIGHLVVDARGAVCACGRRGCLQAIASGPATLRRAAQQRRGPVSADELREGFARQQPWAVTAVHETAAALAIMVVNLSELLKPEVVRIGGGFAAGLPGLIPAVAGEASQLDRAGHAHAPVEAAAFGGCSSLHGALLLAREPP